MKHAVMQRDLVETAQAALPDNALSAVRRAALDAYGQQEFPTTAQEDWRYTNLSPAAELGNDWLRELGKGVQGAVPAVPELPDIAGWSLLLVDGQPDDAALRTLQAEAAGTIDVARLSERPEAIRPDGALDVLNVALLRDGLHVRVPADARPPRPLAVYLHDGAGPASQARIVVDVERGATLELIEYHLAGADEAHYANSVVEINLADGAAAKVVRVQRRPRAQAHTGKLTARLGRDARLELASFDLGGGLVRHDVVVDIAAAGASVSLQGLYLADGEQHIDNHTRIDHRVGPASSREEYRGILNGRARCVWNGKAIVHAGADGTDAEQANHNLLLSARAEIDTKPELEIYADDVKCAHGATVGQLDESALFYLQSRGLDRDEAAHVLTRAFAATILSRLPIAELADHLERCIDRRLDELLENPDS